MGRIEPANATSQNFFGTGWVVDPGKGLVLTNLHVVEAMARRLPNTMLRTGTFDHGDWYSRLRRHGVRGRTLGETIAWGVGADGTARAIVRMWLASPPHRSTLLRRGFRYVGVGVATGTFSGFGGASGGASGGSMGGAGGMMGGMGGDNGGGGQGGDGQGSGGQGGGGQGGGGQGGGGQGIDLGQSPFGRIIDATGASPESLFANINPADYENVNVGALGGGGHGASLGSGVVTPESGSATSSSSMVRINACVPGSSTWRAACSAARGSPAARASASAR